MEIKLTQNKVALVSDEDFMFLSQWKWHALKNRVGNTFYARHMEGNQLFITHRLIMNAQPGEEVDHINGDGLDNRRENLRICTHAENMGNQKKRCFTDRECTSVYRGVCWKKKNKKWCAQITYNYKKVYIGLYLSESDAARAYNKKADELFGSFANLNSFEEGINVSK